jgi:dTDP-4-dehydrorhamnose 3,5-epimerase-like enzyme
MQMPFSFEKLAIPEVLLITPNAVSDSSRVFMETF